MHEFETEISIGGLSENVSLEIEGNDELSLWIGGNRVETDGETVIAEMPVHLLAMIQTWVDDCLSEIAQTDVDPWEDWHDCDYDVNPNGD